MAGNQAGPRHVPGGHSNDTSVAAEVPQLVLAKQCQQFSQARHACPDKNLTIVSATEGGTVHSTYVACCKASTISLLATSNDMSNIECHLRLQAASI